MESKERLALIIALLKDSELIILDEPTAGLDYKRMSQVSEVINERAKEVPVILITHDLELLLKYVIQPIYYLRRIAEKLMFVVMN